MFGLETIIVDPLANYHSLAENKLVNYIADISGFYILPQHAHEILIFTAFYFGIYTLSLLLTPRLLSSYGTLSPRVQHGFHEHIVSQVNAIMMCALSVPLFFTQELSTLTSYTPYGGFVAAHTLGYFIWDLWDTTVYFKYNGIGYFAHAATAFMTFLQPMRPFLLKYAAPFMWFEASTPFVNINWFAGYIPGLISPGMRQLNGLVLLVVFFFSRIVAGPINGYRLFREVINSPPEGISTWVVYSVLFCYVTLSALNFFWFSKMLKILKKSLKQRSKSD